MVIFLASTGWTGWAVWALVARGIFEALARFVALTWLSGKRYGLVGFKVLKSFGNELRFGLDIVVSRLLAGWVGAADKLIIGKFVPLNELGAYTRSHQLAMMPDGNLRNSITTPALSYLARSEASAKNYINLTWVVFVVAGMRF